MSSQSNDNTEGQISPTGILKIKVPHWLVQVRIYDSAYKLIECINEFKQVNVLADFFEAETSLTPGIYEIEVSLANKVERKLISVRPERTTLFELSGNEWKSIQMRSFVPLDNTKSERINKTNADGDANVFLNVQKPKKLGEKDLYSDFFDLKIIPNVNETYPQFDKAYSLINSENNLVVSSDGMSFSFSTDLPSGLYMLEFLIDEPITKELTKEELIKIYQPVFFHSGWCTQLFISTHKPASEAFSMNIVKMGEVAPIYDEAVMAIEAVLTTLSLDIRRSIVNKDEMKKLLSDKQANPWLGILAAYALNSPISVPYEKTKLIGEDSKNLLDDILLFLKREIPDHPDVHALHLELDKPAEKPFYYPPMIYKGLRRIKMHAEKHESTIPSYSLTDYVLRTTLMNGPWVAWEKLSVPVILNALDPMAGETTENLSDSLAEIKPDELNKPIVELTGAVTSKAPIFRLSTEVEPSSTDGTPSQSSQVTSSLSTLQEASLISIVQEIAKKTNYNELPDKYAINYADSLYYTLSSIKASEISVATSLPLSRVIAGIDSLRKKKNQMPGSKPEENSQIMLSYDEQLIIKYALQVAGEKKDFDLPAEMFRSGENVKELNLKLPRMNMNFMGQTKEVRYTEVDGLALFEGDIVLGLAEKVEEAQSRPVDRGITIDGDRFRWGQKENGKIKKVVVPYVAVPQLEQVVKNAIAHWEKYTPIRFVKLTTEPDYISFENLNGCYSRIGRQGGRQVISLGSGCGLGSAIHEIGHALGLFHEQSREDRDQHIKIIEENVITAYLHNFDKHILDASDQGSYDFGSIMHYPATAFSKNGLPTIRTAAGKPIGQRQGLSKGDIQAIKAIYPDLSWPDTDVVADDLTIEQCIARLKAEQDRIMLGSKEKDDEYTKSSQLYAHRLQKVAIELLKRAAFMAVTNSRGKITHGNGAFVNLISFGDKIQDESASIRGATFYQFTQNNRKRNLPQWETALQELPLGKSIIKAPVENSYFNVWEVKRSQLEEQVEGMLNNYLNILQGIEAPLILERTKQEIGDLLCDLENNTPLYAHHSDKNVNPYSKEINKIIHELEKLVSLDF